MEDARPLLKLPDNPYPVIERVAVSVGKTPYVRFDLNDYRVPHTQVRKTLTVLADPDRLRIVNGSEVLACHRAATARAMRSRIPPTSRRSPTSKRQSRRGRATDQSPGGAGQPTLLLSAAERGDNLGAITAGLMRLLRRYGAAELEAAIREALDAACPIPMRCAWRSNSAARPAARPRRSPSSCPTMSASATPWRQPVRSPPTMS